MRLMPPTYMGRKTFRWAKMRSGLSKNTMTKKHLKNWEVFKSMMKQSTKVLKSKGGKPIKVKSHPLFQPLSPLLSSPNPSFQWYPQSKEISLTLSMKCWNSSFHAQGLRLIIVVVQVGAVKIYVHSSRGGAPDKGKRGWNSVYYQNWWKN